jgi:sigma-B regulation protein RsbU (phosphoserine phosphatase)
VLVRANGELLLLESTGMPIGMLDIAMYEVMTMQLQPGDKLVLFSDGLSEAANAEGECFDKKALQKLLCTHAGVGCAELHAKLVDAVEDFSEAAEQEDDITMLVLEYQP